MNINKPIAAIFVAAILFPSCAAEQKTGVPCRKMKSSTEYVREVGVAESQTLNTARDKARMDANTKLAFTLSSITSRVLNVDNQGNTDMQRRAVRQQMSGVAVACTDTQHKRPGRYKVYVVLELPQTEMWKRLEQHAREEDMLVEEGDEENLRNRLDEEIEKEIKRKSSWWSMWWH